MPPVYRRAAGVPLRVASSFRLCVVGTAMMDAVKLALVGAALLLAGLVAAAFGVISAADLGAIVERVWPILAFVAAVSVVAELSARAGVFDVVAGFLARLARGRTVVLWLMIVALAVVVTAFLSLDTTAVLLTPVVVAIARANGLPPLPFAFTTVWIANAASLVLPVSNLTNLLAEHRLEQMGVGSFITLLGASATVAIVVIVGLLFLIHRRTMTGRYSPSAIAHVVDRPQLLIAATTVTVMMPLLVSGIPPWIPATCAVLVLLGSFLWRSPKVVTLGLVPWQLLVFASGLFLAVGALESLGSAHLLGVLAGSETDLPGLWQLAGAGMLGANTVNNLPAYLAFETSAGSPARLAALLVGVNAGPLITPWASLATLLWHQRLHAMGVHVPWRRFVVWGLLAAPLTVALAVVPLAFLQ